MRLNPLSGRWPDTPLAHVAGGAVAAVAVAVVSGLVAALGRRQDDIASAPGVAAFWFVVMLAIGVVVAFMGSLAYAASRGVRPSSLRWVLLTLVQLAPIGLLLLHLARTTGALVGPWHLLSIAAAHALWNAVFLAGCRPTMLDAVARPPQRAMESSRGGYASIDPAEALRQAERSGARNWPDRLLGVPGSSFELIRLCVVLALLGLIVALSVGGAVGFLRLPMGLPLAIATAALSAAVAAPTADWLCRPYRSVRMRRALWGLSAAAVFLVSLRVTLAALLLAKLRLDGVAAHEAGIGAFHGAATFTLMMAMPAWGAWWVWGWLRRGRLAVDDSAPRWRLALPILLIVTAMAFMGMEGAHMDGLRR